MRIRSLISTALAGSAVVAAGLSASAQAPDDHSKHKAVVVLIPTKGSTVAGTVIFTETAKGTQVKAEVTGLTPGKHGFHIHEYGDASSPDGKAAGGHFNPAKHPHGDPAKSDPRHVGDLGNLVADQAGKATYDEVIPHLPLHGENSILGHGVVVHEKADDFGQPVGNAGGRVAVGVIGIAKGD
ncbi:superoxide dismutase family protein [Tundrisphaera sp. TA3]|uniref:superoxide dismutase family protein n=1 Tax=Tundrisphaera sp. TA3 TaxID=3435775 RepID=UPI003EBE9E8F